MQIFISKKIICLLCIFLMSVIYFKFQAQDDRPIKFEKYNDQEFQKFIKGRFKIGDFLGTAVDDLASSKINRIIFIEVTDDCKQMYPIDSRYAFTAKYKSPFFSLSPLAHYEVFFSLDENLKIIHISAYKERFIEYFWW